MPPSTPLPLPMVFDSPNRRHFFTFVMGGEGCGFYISLLIAHTWPFSRRGVLTVSQAAPTTRIDT